MRKEILTTVFSFGLVMACAGGSVARFAPCSSTDSCPSATACEAVTVNDNGTSISVGSSFCTWSCSDGVFNEQQCPNDAHGVQGVCVAGLGGTPIGGNEFGFCFQDCSTGATCPDGETCSPAQTYSGASSVVCVPTPSDPLSGTSWTSTTITPNAQSYGVSTSTFTLTFGAATTSVADEASGPLTATLAVTYDSSAFQDPGCAETLTLTGATWVDLPPTQTSDGVFTVTGTQGTTMRTGCTMSSDNVSNDTGLDIETINNGASYTVSGSTLTVMGGNGGVPYASPVPWTFTKN